MIEEVHLRNIMAIAASDLDLAASEVPHLEGYEPTRNRYKHGAAMLRNAALANTSAEFHQLMQAREKEIEREAKCR